MSIQNSGGMKAHCFYYLFTLILSSSSAIFFSITIFSSFWLSDSEFWYRDVTLPVSGTPIQKAAASEGRCRSKETVQLECEEFGKPASSDIFLILVKLFGIIEQ